MNRTYCGSVAAIWLCVAASLSLADEKTYSGPYLGQDPPGTAPALFSPGFVSTDDANIHSTLTFAPGGQEAYFARLIESPGFAAAGKIFMIREVNGVWEGPVELTGTGDAFTPMLSPDGERLVLATHSRIKVMERSKSGWADPVDCGDLVNFQQRQDGACETDDGTLYFTSMFGVNNGMFRARIIDGEYRAPEKIQTGYEGRPADGYPYVAPDGSYMVFMSWRPGGFGKWDLYAMFRSDDGGWGAAINLGPTINTAASESFPAVSPDGKYLFFNSNRESALTPSVPSHFYGNIYWVEADSIPALHP